MKYPEHKHPHGIKDVKPSLFRIWVCEECYRVFEDEEMREDSSSAKWGHKCPLKRTVTRCESHLEPYMPEPCCGDTKGE